MNAMTDPAVLWTIEQRAEKVVATNPTTGEVWESDDLFAVCFAIAGRGNDMATAADWLRYLAQRCDDDMERVDG